MSYKLNPSKNRLALRDPSHAGHTSCAAAGPLPLTLPRVAWVWEATQFIHNISKYTYIHPKARKIMADALRTDIGILESKETE